MGSSDGRGTIGIEELSTNYGVSEHGRSRADGHVGGSSSSFLGTRHLAYEPQQKFPYVGSTSALALSEGSESWRTRHLRVKAKWLYVKLTAGEFAARHCEGRVQLVDLLTKAMPWSRIREMLLLWGFDIGEELAGTTETVVANASVPSSSSRSSTHSKTAATRVLAFIILMSCVAKGGSSGQNPNRCVWIQHWFRGRF